MRMMVLIISIFVLISCDKGNRCFDRPGDSITIIRSIDSNYSLINIYDDLNVTLINDSLNIVEIIGGKNMVENVTLTADNYSLSIFNENKCTFVSNHDDLMINIHYTSLKELGLYGFGEINSPLTLTHDLKIVGQNCFSTIDLEFDNDSIYFSLEGAPQVTLSGNSDHLYAYTVGKGNYFMKNLKTLNAHAHNRGIGDIHISADSSYIIELRSRGDIYISDTVGKETLLILEGEGSLIIE